MSKRGSLTSAKSLHELKRDPMLDEPSSSQDSKGDNGDAKITSDEGTGTSKGIRPSKSETSIIDSFVVIESEYARRKNNANALREGNFGKIFFVDFVYFYINFIEVNLFIRCI